MAAKKDWLAENDRGPANYYPMVVRVPHSMHLYLATTGQNNGKYSGATVVRAVVDALSAGKTVAVRRGKLVIT